MHQVKKKTKNQKQRQTAKKYFLQKNKIAFVLDVEVIIYDSEK